MTDKLAELIDVLARLRAPGGCAWDREQTHESLVRYLIEETYELVEAIETGSRDELLEELGDVLYQVIFHADIAAHTPGEQFDLEDVAEHMTRKMVGRHPHVFGDAIAETAEDVVAIWDGLKAVEKPERSSVLDGIPLGMPALALADKLVGRAAKVAVSVGGSETVEAAAASTEAELGARLLGLVASAHAAGLNSERALRGALRGLQEEIRDAEAGAPASRSFDS
jgi:XTP/dITP diphosphohydrolase